MVRPHPPSSLSEAQCLHQGKALDYLCTCELPTYEDGVAWTVTSWDEGERAVASLASNIKPSLLVVLSTSLVSNIKPSRLVVLSTHTRPIPGLGDLLYRLAYHHTGDISLLPLDSFWRPTGQSDEGMVIVKFSDRLDALYCSPGQVVDYFSKRHSAGMQSGSFTAPKLQTRVTKEGTGKIGVRFDNDCDVGAFKALPKQIDDACCVRGMPRTVSSQLLKNGCSVTRWHFPDLCDDDLDWMISILYRFRGTRLSLVLPRNGLTATGARRLFATLPDIHEVYHDPGASPLTSDGNSGAPDLTFIELSMNNIIQWM
ncbi:uncharacterized protein LOC108668467 [Hyalella azteca]|uniref:Uncharacterized protein LOC108668467 n=1 Tax=Hyalella azteca TaxID=294128 RepID=A0A8B7NC55_HYAAZ|nr:uncharacterized protein LOC108668467 [Hyalella azteca]